MLRKGAFIMRVRKVDSDAIKLYESSQVKFKTTGTIREVQFSAGVNKSCAIQNISKDTYLDKATGEIKERKHNTNRFQSLKSVRKSINRLTDLIRCNATHPAYCKWITLTYADTMTDTVDFLFILISLPAASIRKNSDCVKTALHKKVFWLKKSYAIPHFPQRLCRRAFLGLCRPLAA